jgi:hypothetical protein
MFSNPHFFIFENNILLMVAPRNPFRKRLVGEARKDRLNVLKSVRKFRELNKWYEREAQRLTPAKVAQGVNTELAIFILGKVSLPEKIKSEAAKLFIEDGRNMALMMDAHAGVPYKKADFLARIDHALKVLPEVESELIRTVPHGKEIVNGLPSVRKTLAADPRVTSVRGAGIMQDISIINTLKLRKILGEEKFNQVSKLLVETMREIQKRGH